MNYKIKLRDDGQGSQELYRMALELDPGESLPWAELKPILDKYLFVDKSKIVAESRCKECSGDSFLSVTHPYTSIKQAERIVICKVCKGTGLK